MTRAIWAGLALLAACGGTGTTPEGSSAGASEATEPNPPRTIALQEPLLGELASDSFHMVVQLAEPGFLTARLRPVAGEGPQTKGVDVLGPPPWSAHLVFDGLRPDTEYELALWARDAVDPRASAAPPDAVRRVRTAPSPDTAAPLRFVFSGDVAGQNVCRDAAEGFPLVPVMVGRHPRFSIALGDTIYGDGPCGETGAYGNRQAPGRFRATPSETITDYLQRWAYVQHPDGLLPLVLAAPYYAVWDDHEVANDFDPGHAQLAAGRAAFLATNPLGDGEALRTFRWGRHVDLILLDTRRHRAPNAATGDKTMLGEAQREALLAHLRASTATWQLIVTSMPLTIPTGGTLRDGWADGMDVVEDGDWARVETIARRPSTLYEAEARQILELAHELGRRVVFLSADVHFAEVLRLHPFGDAWVTHEVVVGPLNAGLFPNRALDASFRPERLFFYGPDPVEPRWEAARAFFNFGEVEVAADGALTIRVRGLDDAPLFQTTLAP